MPNEGKRESPWNSILARDIDEYLGLLPDEPRNALQHLRGTIGTAVPEALEKIYYRIPTFMYRGPLVGFSASADHGSLHLMSPPLMKAHQEASPVTGFRTHLSVVIGTTTANLR